MPIKTSLAPEYKTPEAIYEGECLRCRGPLGVEMVRLHSYAVEVPCVVCMGDCEYHVLHEIGQEEFDAYVEFVSDIYEANEAYCRSLEADWQVQ